MERTFTQKITYAFPLLLLWMLYMAPLQLHAQGNSVPVHEVNLTGQPNGIWNSGDLSRNGSICGAKGNENCIQFNITLDKNAGGLEFSITGGPVPSGAMAYQIDCGPPVPVGQPICVSGVGPHVLTICMPGGASNSFQVKSIAAFTPVPDVKISGGCSSVLQAPIAFEEASITWTDITGGGAYNKYLSCTSGCATPTITPDDNAPAFVDYVVCGSSVASPCSDLPFCDTVRVYFFPAPIVSISPTPAIICPGSTGVELTGNVTGGSGNFSYFWTNKSGQLLATTKNYIAPTVGEYFLEVRTENYPNCKKFEASVTVVTDLSVNAGPDQLICTTSPVSLTGSVTAATGGIWSGGAGSFSPNNTSLNATYTPTASELAAGKVKLTLTTTVNGTCSPISDEVLISFYQFNLTFTGPAVICAGSTATITAATTGGQAPITYQWNTGETTATVSNKAAGTYTVTATDAKGCSIQKSFTVSEEAGPSAVTITSTPSTCGNSNGSLQINGVTGGRAPYLYSLNGSEFKSATSYTALSAGTYSISVKDANGCVYSNTYILQNISGPTGFTTSTTSTTCGNSNGSITVSNVINGQAPFTYSKDGVTFQSTNTFSGVASGSYTITVKDANGCLFTKTVVVGSAPGPTTFAFNTSSSTCGASNGGITVTSVTGGTAPFTYSKDGVSFQETGTFTALAAGTYTITVKDANGCITSRSIVIGNIAGPSDLTASITSSTCGNSNGTLSIAATGGTAPYTYSLNGGAFQTASSFQALAAGTYSITVRDTNGCSFSKAFTVNNIAGPSDAALTTKATTCGTKNGTIAVASVTGGTAPYTYSLNGAAFQSSASFSGLSAGQHLLTIKDANGCTFVKTVLLENIAGPTEISLTAASSTCGSSNGSVTVTSVIGGTAPYSYSTNGTTFQASATLAGLSAGTYTVTVKDANGCTITRQVSVRDVAGPSGFTASLTPSTCGGNNGSINIGNVSGGTAPFSYSKDGIHFQASATFTSLKAGSYMFTVKDANGCVYAKEVRLSDIAGPTAVTASTASASCLNNDGEIKVTGVTGGSAPYSYSIDGTAFQTGTAFTVLASGNYTVTAKDANGCLVTTAVVVKKNVPTGFTTSTVASTCGRNNGTFTVVSVTGGTAPYYYSQDGINFQASSTFSSLAAGTYTITVKDAKGCTFTKSVVLNNVAGPTEANVSTSSSTCGYSNAALTVTEVTGGTSPYTYSLDGTNYQTSATFNQLQAGQHTVAIKDANGCTYTKLVVIEDVAGPQGVESTVVASTCGASNGRVMIESVNGGTAPFTYSKDGVQFQASATFENLIAGTYSILVKDANGCLFSKTIEVTDQAGPRDIAMSNQASTCGASNGSIKVEGVSGGMAPYTYSLNGQEFQTNATYTGVPAGEHTVTVKDANGCSFTKKVRVENLSGPTALASTTVSSSCGRSNGALSVNSVTGGTAPYSYSKDGVNFQASATFTELAAGTYTIYVKDANACTFAQQVAVRDVPGPSAITAVSSSASCLNNDGSISISGVTGGTAPYTYSIGNTNFQTEIIYAGISSGTYTITAKDANGCLVSTQVTVGQNVPTAFTFSTTETSCGRNDGTITVGTVTGGTAPYQYSIDGGVFQSNSTFTGLLAGTHTISVRDAKGCTYSKGVSVSNTAGPAFTVTATASTCGNTNGAITVKGVTGGTAPYLYSIDGTNFQSSATFMTVGAGVYLIMVKDTKGCLSSEEIEVKDIAGPSDLTLAVSSSTCGSSNGSINISSVAGGTSPYTYSINGAAFQNSAAFTSLPAGNHTITVKDANGCTFNKEVQLENIYGPTDLALATAASTCGASNGTITVRGVTGGVAPYSFALNGGSFQSSTAFAPITAGEHTVTVKDANGCVFTKKATVTNVAGPTDLTAEISASICGNSNGALTLTKITGGTAPYSYSRDGVNFQPSPTFTALAAGTHTLFVKDANGCTFNKSFVINNINGPAAVTASSSPATCADNDGSIIVDTVTGGTAPFVYSLDGVTFQEYNRFTALSSGTYTVTAKDTNGCLVTASVKVSKNIPTAFDATTVASTCGNSNGSITILNITGGTSPYSYSLDGKNFQSSATLTGLVASTYTITVKDANGCTFAGQIQITNTPGPQDFTSSVQASTCGNSNGSISIRNVDGGTVPFTYSLNGTVFQNSSTFTGLRSGTFTVTVKDANGCSFVKQVLLEDIAGPTEVRIASKPAICGTNGQLEVREVTGGTAPFSYSVDGVQFQSSASFSALAANTYTLTVKDANGCTFSQTAEVEYVTGPAALTLTSSPSTCGGANGGITVNGVNGGTAPYTYSIDGVNFQTSVTFTALAANTYQVYVKDANGCTYTQKAEVSNIAGPTTMTTAAQPANCTNSDGSITVSNVTGGTAPFTYSINGSTYQESGSFSGLAAGLYTVTVKDANGCQFASGVRVGQNAPTAFTVSTTETRCGNSDGTITILSVTGGTGPYTYSQDGQRFQASATFQNLSAGSHIITVKDANGCTYSKAVAVNNVAGPAFTATVVPSTCGNSNGKITIAETRGGTAPYSFSIDGVHFQTSATFTALTAATYSITVKDSTGCMSTEVVVIEDKAGPTDFIVSAQASTCGSANGQLQVATVTGGTAPYTYSINGSVFQDAIVFTALTAGTYTITVKDANGCTFSKQASVNDIASPAGLELASTTATCGSNNGTVMVTTVKGGTAPFTFSLDGKEFKDETTFTAVTAGKHVVTVRDANGCTYAETVTVTDVTGPTGITVSTQPSTCGGNNGSLTVELVTGGVAPYTYSINGGPFQHSTSFPALQAGTHTLSVKDGNGCTFSKEMLLQDLAGPTAATVDTTPASCSDRDGAITVKEVSGGSAPYAYSLDGLSFQSSASFTGLASGTYSVTVQDANGCLTTEVATVAKTAPSAFTTSVAPSTCGNGNGSISITTINGGTAPYKYSIDGSTFTSSASFDNLSAGTYKVTVLDAKGCEFADQVQVKDLKGIESVAAAVTGTTCNNSNGTVTVTAVIGGTAPYTYSKDGVNFQSSAFYSGLTAGAYAITVKDANGCTYSTEVTISGTEGPTDITLTQLSSSCGQANGQITVTNVVAGVAPYTYSKDGVNFQETGTFTALTAGSYTIVVKDSNGCTYSKSIEVESISGPTDFAYTTTASTCGNRNGSISIGEISGGTAPFIYSLNGAAFQSQTTFNEVAEGLHTLTVKDASGCTITKEVSVSNLAGVTAITTSTTPATCSEKGSFKVTSTTGGKAPYAYSLDGVSYQTSSTFTVLSPQAYQVFVKDANGCVFTSSVTVTENKITKATLSSVSANCAQNNGSINVESVTGGTLPLAYSINGISFQSAAVFSNLGTGNYTITIKDAAGCTFTQSHEVKGSGGAESFTLTNTDATCGTNNGTIIVSQISGGRSPYTFSIDGSNFQTNPEFTRLASGKHVVTVKDAAGCVKTKEINLGNSSAITGVIFTTQAAGCSQTTGQVVVKEVTGGTAPYTYSTDGTRFSASATLTGLAPGTYQLTVKDANNCTYSTSVLIKKVESKIALVQDALCSGQANGSISVTTKGGEGKAEFSIDNGRTFLKDSVFTNLAGGSYQVLVRFSPECTVNLGTVEIKEPKPIQVKVTALSNTVAASSTGSAAVTFVGGGTAPYTYQLDKGRFTTDSVFHNLSEGTHLLVVKDKNGCTTEVNFTIEASQDFEIPTGFSPNGDGLNDLWEIKNISTLYPNCKITVYNRWGSPVFESKGYRKPWDGTYNGQPLPNGTYYCTIDLGNAQPLLKKSITIMR